MTTSSIAAAATVRRVPPRNRREPAHDRRPPGGVAYQYTIDRDRRGDVLDLMLAHRLEGEADLVAELVVDVARDADAAGLGQLLHPIGDIHAVAEEVAALYHDVADIDADAELQPLVLGHRLVAPGDLLLDLDRAQARLHGARELGDDAVAGAVEDAPAMGRHQPVDDLTMRPQGVERSLLVSPHQPAVAGDVGGKDRGKLAFHDQGYPARRATARNSLL